MKNHTDAHFAGSLQGDVPATWVDSHSRTRCLVCGLSVSRAHGVHPTCRPAARAAAVDGAARMDTDGLQLPSLNPIQAPRCGVFPASPATAGTKCLQGLLPQCVVHTNDDKAGRELLMLPKCVLCAPPRFSPRHHKAVGACILDRLHRWQEGERLGALGFPAFSTNSQWSAPVSGETSGFGHQPC